MVRIFSDSTCDLSPELIRSLGVTIIPLHVLLGDKEHLDGVDISPDALFAWADQNRTTPKTSAVSVAEAMSAFRPELKAGNDILCFSISGKLSGTYQNMCMAVEELNAVGRIRIIDSQNLSTGIGLLVARAAELASQGLELQPLASAINALIPKVRSSFVVDTLTYLHRGGRCSSVTALAGSALRIHPRIAVTCGEMGVTQKYRGKMSKVIVDYTDDLLADLTHADPARVFITHTGFDQDLLDKLHDKLASLQHFREIHIMRAGSVISSHCGPGTLGILYIAE